jgi:hypothetical protein
VSKKDKLEKEIDFLKEEFNGYFLILVALLTGESGIIYTVVSGEKPIFVLLLAVFGVFFIIFLYAKIQQMKAEIYKNLNELGDE